MTKHLQLLIALLIAIQLPISAEKKLTISPYLIPIDYQNIQNKTDQTGYGAHAFWELGLKHAIEADAGQLLNNTEDILQSNFVTKYTYYGVPRSRLSLGVHAVSVDDNVNGAAMLGDASAIFGGIERDIHDSHDVYRASTGLSIYYAEHVLSGGNVNVTQIAPYRKSILYLWRAPGTLASMTQVNYGFLSHDIGFGNKSWASVSETITYTNYPWTLDVMTWAGEEQLATKENGFLIVNIQEKHKAGASIKLTYAMSRKIKLTGSYHYGIFEEVGRVANSTFSKFVAMLSYTL